MARQLLAFEERHDTNEIRGASDRSFGRVFAGFFLLLGGWPLVHSQPPRWWAFGAAAVFLALSIFVPRWLAPLNRAWSWIGKVLHAIVSPLLMGAIFFLAITPIAIVRRLRAQDPLGLRFDSGVATYWKLRDPPGPAPESIRQQF